MIDALVAGKLIQTPTLRTGASGKPFTNFLLSVAIGEDQPVVVSGIAFGEASEKITKLAKGDSLAVKLWMIENQAGRRNLTDTLRQSRRPVRAICREGCKE